VSWLLGSLIDTDHAPAPVEWGQDDIHDVVLALFNSPLWPKTALFITYDEGGGFFDHVPPPVPTATSDKPGEFIDVAKMTKTAPVEAGAFARKPIGLGFRVPMLVISPFTRNPNPSGPPIVCSDVFDHNSVLLFLERIFGVRVPRRDPTNQIPGLSRWREKTIGDMTTAFNFAAGRNTTAATIPQTNHADPRVLAECPVPGTTLLTGQFDQGYPVPAQTPIPNQESSVAPIRPSGPVAGQAACPPLTATGASPKPGANPGVSTLPNTPQGPAGSPALAVASVAGGVVLAGAWWSRRVRANGVTPAASGAGEDLPA
jgi:phospholipase C